MFQRFYILQGINLYSHKREFGYQVSYTKNGIRRFLNQQGIAQSRIENIPAAVRHKELSVAELIFFIQSMLSFLRTGISFQEALAELFRHFKSPLLRYVCCLLHYRLHRGENLKDSFAALSKNFPAFFLSMIGLAQAGGNLEKGLQDCLSFYEKMEQRRKKVQEIINYPLFVLGFSLALVLLVLIAVIPLFQGVYHIYGSDLPVLTKIAVWLSNGLRNNYVTMLIVLAVLLLLKKYTVTYWLNPLSLLYYGTNRLKQQLLDPFLFSYSISILLNQAMPLDSSLKTIASMLAKENENKIQKIITLLHKGIAFSGACKKVNFYWKEFSLFLNIAEKSGDLEAGFVNIYKFWQQKFEFQTKWIGRILHSTFILIASCIILLIFLAVYLPIFELGTRGEF